MGDFVQVGCMLPSLFDLAPFNGDKVFMWLVCRLPFRMFIYFIRTKRAKAGMYAASSNTADAYFQRMNFAHIPSRGVSFRPIIPARPFLIFRQKRRETRNKRPISAYLLVAGRVCGCGDESKCCFSTLFRSVLFFFPVSIKQGPRR